MSSPDQFTSAMAGDPATPAQTLADIATHRPDLRAAVATNPAAYPGLLEWLGSLGDPAVDAALAARAAAPAEPAAPYDASQTGVAQPPAGHQAPEAFQPPAGYQSLETPAATGYPATTGYPPPGAYQPPAGYQPPTGYQAPEAQHAPAGYPGAQPGYPQQPAHQPEYAPVGPAGSSGSRTAIIVVVSLLVVALVVAAILIVPRMLRQPTPPPGTDAALDRLWVQCDEGDMASCDRLYMESEIGSEYESWGDSCGGREDVNWGYWCDAASQDRYGS